MKAVIEKQFTILFGDVGLNGLVDRVQEESVDEDDCTTFNKGELVEVIKVIKDSSYDSGKCYVIINSNNDSVSIDARFLKILEDD